MKVTANNTKKKILIALGIIFIIISPTPLSWESDKLLEMSVPVFSMFLLLSAGFFCLFTAK